MRKKSWIALVLASLMLLSLLAGCANNPPAATEKPVVEDKATTPPVADETDPPVEEDTPTDEPQVDTEHYTFMRYYNYDTWGIKPWGEDEISKYWDAKMNITMEQSKPDADAQAKLNVMITSGDLPDSIVMDRGMDNNKMIDLGMLVPLEPLMDVNPTMKEILLPNTLEFLKVKGNVYGIPHWARSAATGGNDTYMYEKKHWEAVGSPKLETLDDLYNFAVAVRDAKLKNNLGQDVIPFTLDDTLDAGRVKNAFFRSYGGFADDWYSVVDGKYQSIFRDPLFVEASAEGNRWWREGLFAETQFTDTWEQILERLSNGRTALLYYDFSQDSPRKFRRILMEKDPTDSFEIVSPFPYPPAKGLSTDKIYPDVKSTPGGQATFITTKAEKPQRIYDLFAAWLTKEGAITMMYGPQGENWDELDANGNPILKVPEAELSVEENNRLGVWNWACPSHSDTVDFTKFAVNALQPPEKQDWVITQQANIFSPIMWVSDEFVNVRNGLDPLSEAGIANTLCRDFWRSEYPKAIMAKTEAEYQSIMKGIVEFLDANNFASVEENFNAVYQANVAIVGTGLTR